MDEIMKLHEMLVQAGINHTFMPMPMELYGRGAFQICVYRDASFQEELDDAVYHDFSYGHKLGLLETYSLGGCNGFETATEIFEGWMEKYFSATP